jgi:hypothetical protein
MWAATWAFFQNPDNRVVLGWIGGAVVVVAGAFWTVFKFFYTKSDKPASSPTVSASNGGVAAGRDMQNTRITTNRSDPKV